MKNKGCENQIDFIGIGAARSGTTWVAACLKEHPQILFSSRKSRKELSFFNTNNTWQGDLGLDLSTYSKGIEWYLHQFPDPEPGKIRGEFSVSYLIDEKACERIKNFFPNVKLLVVLRNPVDMVYSLHRFGSAGAVSGKPYNFEEALKKGYYLDFGLYCKHLKKFYDIFPEKQICTTLFDDIKTKPLKAIQNIYSFLGVDPNYVPRSLMDKENEAFLPRFELIKKCVHGFLRFLSRIDRDWYFKVLDSNFLVAFYSKINKVKFKYPPLDKKVRERLKGYFVEDIEKLERLIQRDLSVWK